MAKRKTWSVSGIRHPKYPGYTLRIAEHKPGGMLHVYRWVDGRQTQVSLKKTRAQLGCTPEEQKQAATDLAIDTIEILATTPEGSSTPTPSVGPMKLRALATRYEDDGFAGRTPNYKRDSLAAIARVSEFVGADMAVMDLKLSHVEKYMAHRKKQGHAAAGRSDLVALSIAINWAIGNELLTDNPLAKAKVRQAMRIKAKPMRPVADKARYVALRFKARELPPAFGVLLDLTWHTGRRISAILGLRWQDVSFNKPADAPNGSVTWYAGAVGDNKKHEHTRPMNSAASAALKAWQKETGGIGAQWVFPSETDYSKSLERHTTKKWLRRAETLAELDHLKHGGWHMFRRGWATERKHMPLKDVAEAGGWQDTQSVLDCYVHTDAQTTRKVALMVV